MREKLHRLVHRITGIIGSLPEYALPEKIKRLLCMVHGGLGDRLMTLPVLRQMRKLYPEAYMCVAWSGESLEEIDRDFDETLEFLPNDFISQWNLIHAGWDCLFVNSVGARSITTEVITAFSRIPLRIGPKWQYQKKSVYNRPYDLRFDRHFTVLNCSWMGDNFLSQPLPYHVQFTSGHNDAHSKAIVLHPGVRIAYSGYEQKRWQTEKFAELAVCLKRIYENIQILAIVGPDDESVETAKLEKTGILIKHPLSLRELFSIISQAYVFVGNDSGPAHVSAALSVPSVVLFGPTNPLHSAPVSDKTVLICAGLNRPVRYSELREYKPAPMDNISIEVVLEGIKMAIEGALNTPRGED